VTPVHFSRFTGSFSSEYSICTDDFLFVDEGEEPFRNRLIASGERHFGIAFYFDKQMEPEELYKTFIGKGKILGLKG